MSNSLTKIQSDFYNDVKFPNYDDVEDFGSLLDKLRQNDFVKKRYPPQNGVIFLGGGRSFLSDL